MMDFGPRTMQWNRSTGRLIKRIKKYKQVIQTPLHNKVQ